MTTLTKSIEAAREHLEYAAKSSTGSSWKDRYICKALAALPDSPKSEDEIYKIVYKIIDAPHAGAITKANLVVKALRAENCLYVKED